MNKNRNYIIWDGIVASYVNSYGKDWESKLVEEFRKHLADLAEKSELMLITGQETTKVTDWLEKHGLRQYITAVSNKEF